MNGRLRVAAQLLRVLVAASILLALLVGTPQLMRLAAGWPLEWAGWPRLADPPTGADLLAALGRPWTDTAVVDLLASLGWVLWALFVRDVLLEAVETVLILRGARRRHLRRTHDPVRLLASLLVGAIAGGLLSGVASGNPATPANGGAHGGPAHTPVVAVAPHHVRDHTPPDSGANGQGTVSDLVPAAATSPVTGRAVRPAEAHLPTWARTWPGGVYVVRAGDTLWDIAESQDGDPYRWRDWYVASRGHTQPDGRRLTDPDLIQPGWILLRPVRTTAPPPAADHAAGDQPATGTDAAAPCPVDEESPASSPAPTTPAAGAPATPSPPASPTPSVPQTSVTPPSPSAPTSAGTGAPQAPPPSAGVDLPSGAWISAGLAAILATVVAALRLHTRRRARLTWPVPRASTPAAGPPVPDSLTAATSATTTGLRFDRAEALPGLIPDPPPTPAPIGLDAAGQEIALHTLAAPGLALTGPGTSAAARAVLATALATGVLGHLDERPHVVTTTEVLTRLLPPGTSVTGLDPTAATADGERLHLLVGTRTAVARFEQEMLYRRRILDSHDVARADDLDPDHDEALPPFVLLIPAEETHLERVAAVCRQAPALNMAAVVLGATDTLPSPHVDAHGHLSSECDALDGARLATLAATDLDDLLGVLRHLTHPGPDSDSESTIGTKSDSQYDIDWKTETTTSTQVHAGTGEPDRVALPAPEVRGAPPQPNSQQDPVVRLQVLGGVRLVAKTGPITTNVRRDSYLLLALLAAHPGGRTLEEIAHALYPTGVDAVAAKKRSRTATTSLRGLLREATDHEHDMFIGYDSTRYRLDPELFDVDLWRMLTALETATRADDDARALTALQHASDAYGGDFAAGYDRTWITDLAGVYRHQILSALSRIAEITETDRPDAAVAALERALVHDPVNEELYQRLMRIHGRHGHLDAVQRTLHLCEEHLAALGDAEPSETTRRVAERQLRTASVPASVHPSPAATTTDSPLGPPRRSPVSRWPGGPREPTTRPG